MLVHRCSHQENEIQVILLTQYHSQNNMSKRFIQASAAGLAIGAVAYLLFKEDVDNRIQDMVHNAEARKERKEINRKTRELVVSAFVEMIIANPKMSLEEAILKFENAKENETLESFATKKMRTKKSYILSYQSYFDEAKKVMQME